MHGVRRLRFDFPPLVGHQPAFEACKNLGLALGKLGLAVYSGSFQAFHRCTPFQSLPDYSPFKGSTSDSEQFRSSGSRRFRGSRRFDQTFEAGFGGGS
jgi:hypothetical protein